MELHITEEFFIQTLRKFDFLRHLGYDYTSFAIYSREPWLAFAHKKYKREISVIWMDNNFIDVSFQIRFKWMVPKKSSFRLSESYKAFGCEHLNQKVDQEKLLTLLKGNADLIRENLMPIVKGEKWISDYSGLK